MTKNDTKTISKFSFVQTLIAIIIAWTLVTLWIKFIDNLTYRTLGLNKNSTFHALVIALTVSAIFVVAIYSAEDTVSNIILGTNEDVDIMGDTIISRNITKKLNMINSTSLLQTPFELEVFPPKEKSDREIIDSVINRAAYGGVHTKTDRYVLYTDQDFNRRPRSRIPAVISH